MRKKAKITLLALFSALGFAFSASACAITMPEWFPDFGEKTEVTISGFDVKENLEIPYGSSVELEQPFVTDSSGQLLECWSLVTDSKGNYVQVTAGRFSAYDFGGYTITYVVRDSANNTHEKKTVVTVVGAVESETTISVDYEQFVIVGETVEIDATCSDENAVLNYSVVKESNKATVTTQDNTFTVTESGLYTVTVSEESGAEYTYSVFAQEPRKDGEVEDFNEAWEEKESFIGGKRQDWNYVTSEEIGLLDRYGRESSFAQVTTSARAYYFYLTIRENLEYYEQLANEGYEYVSMWIYMVSDVPHLSFSDRDPNGGFYRREGPDLYPNEWIEYRLNLEDTLNTWTRSFISCYEYYQNQEHFYFLVDNSLEWNPWGVDESMTFYIADINAVKPVEVALTGDKYFDKSVGDVVDLSTLFSADCDLDYVVEYRGQKTQVTSEYTFLANGQYKVIAVPKTDNFDGSASVEFTVSDAHSVTATPIIKERTGESVSVSLTELNPEFKEVNGVKPEIVEYKAYYGAEEVALVENAFTATKDGAYSIEVKGTYTEGGVVYTTYQTVSVDVWSSETKYDVLNPNKMLYMSAYNTWDSMPTGTYGEFTVAGKTGEFYQSVSRGESNTVYGAPIYSKHYYESLLTQGENAKVVLDVYIESAVNTSEKMRGVFFAYDKTTNLENNVWHRATIDLQTFIDEYDTIANTYEAYSRIIKQGGRPCPGTNSGQDATGAISYIYGTGRRTVYLDVSVSYEATEAIATIKADKKFVLDTDNDLTELLDVTLDGEVGEIVGAEVYFNKEWIALKNETFNPAWAGEYKFRLDLKTADGSTYKRIETTFMVGDEAFVATVDEKAYGIKTGEDFEVADLLTGDYTFEFEFFKSRGGVLTETTATVEGTVIKGSSLEVGAYVVNVYAIKGDGAFGKILYYTFTLDYFGNYDPATVIIETPTSENMKNIFKSYQYEYNQSLTDTTVTTECPTGNSGTFIKYEGRSNNKKEQMKYSLKPLFSKNYYQTLVDQVKSYSVKFDVYIENVDSACTREKALYLYWNNDGTSFTTHGGTLNLNTWYTIEIPMETIVKNMDKDVQLFGVQIPWGGFATSDLIRYWIGNIRLEEAPMMWSSEALSSATVMSYQWSSANNLQDCTFTTEVPEGGVAGTYIKYDQAHTKEDYRFGVTPFYAKEYYEELLASGKKYKVTFDVYLQVKTNDACTSIKTKFWYTKSDGTSSFATLGSIGCGAWHTAEVDLQYLVEDWGRFIIFGLNLSNQTNWVYGEDYLVCYIGNIQLVEGTATGQATLKSLNN